MQQPLVALQQTRKAAILGVFTTILSRLLKGAQVSRLRHNSIKQGHGCSLTCDNSYATHVHAYATLQHEETLSPVGSNNNLSKFLFQNASFPVFCQCIV